MDSKEPSTTPTPTHPSNPSTSAAAPATTPPPPPPRTSAHDFCSPPVPSSPYVRGSQVGDRTPHPLMMPPYSNPIPYPSMYPQGGVDAQPSLAAAGSVYIATDSEHTPTAAGIKWGPAKKPEVVSWTSRKSRDVTSRSEDGLQSNDHESEGSSEEGNGSASSQESYDTPLAHLQERESEALTRWVDELQNENSALESKLIQLNKICEELESENASLKIVMDPRLRWQSMELNGTTPSSPQPIIGSKNSTATKSNPSSADEPVLFL